MPLKRPSSPKQELAEPSMEFPKINNPQLVALAKTYWQWRMLWLATTGLFAALALFYVVFLKGDTWVASQALMVRDEANGAVMRLGRFESQTEMKAAQETILEMARNAQVLHDALSNFGRPPTWRSWLFGDAPPTAAEVDALARNGIQVRAPRGAELGTTEVIYLDVKQETPERALKLNRVVCDALENRLQQVRQARADGVITELQTAKETAAAQLKQATNRLTRIETETGADLSDLRGMTDSNSGGSGTRQVLDTIKSELRNAELAVQQTETDLQLAKDSYQNPDQLMLTPSSLVNSQAGLKTLRDGLANATINTSQLQGRYTQSHPLVIAALEAEANLREQLRIQLGLSIQTLSKDLDLANERLSKLNAQRLQLEERLENIARIRATYSNLASEVKARNQQLQDAERDLGQAQASRDAAMTSSLITRMDEPQIGEKPIGPGRSTIVAGATISGLFFGLGIVFLLSPIDGGVGYGRRRLDFSGIVGRRATDHIANAAAGSIERRTQNSPNVQPAMRATDSQTANATGTAAPLHPEQAHNATSDPREPGWMPALGSARRMVEVIESWRTSQYPIQPQATPLNTPVDAVTAGPDSAPLKTAAPVSAPVAPNVANSTVQTIPAIGLPLEIRGGNVNAMNGSSSAPA